MNSLPTNWFLASPPVFDLFKLFFFNGLFGFVIVFILLECVQLDINKRKRDFFLLLLSIGVFVPFLGSLFNVMGFILLKRYTKNFVPFEINTFHHVEYSRNKPIKSMAYGEGWAYQRLYSPGFSSDARESALISVSRGSSKDANLIYSSLLSDEVEEFRVRAFSLIENQRNYLHKQINSLLKKNKSITDPHKSAFVAKQIALLYWEFVYRNLSEKEFRAIVLERSEFFAKQSLNVLKDDAILWILLSRINFENQKFQEGFEQLTIASQCNAPRSKLMPYLAEYAYKIQDYHSVRDYLGSDVSFKYIISLNKLIHFWCQR